ncbi:hypothetical protein CC80DRAFT_519375 [Byssothecium circinans]|uniref:Altered inheritance of mitochondria protein 9, mitochondrial n=1 Tax=Byssothecium circinans TaxID=147558 RepID=A0A6A5TH30_9PLEO|nr:hypothetical protein CC80DRAFT_519375 [Byssothecium circinans]
MRCSYSSKPSQTHPDSLFTYTSGLWLWNEKKQLDERYRRFNVPKLEEAACRATGSTRCLSLEKIGEGNFNKAYRLVMEGGQKVVAKVPHPNAGPAVFTTASEVATMEFARTILGLPVPKILAWSASEKNPVEAEYIIMEEAQGSQLHEVWEKLPLRAKSDIMDRIVDVESKLLSVSFHRLGSLYFHDSNIPGCEPAVATADSQNISDQIRSKFSIGPIVRREFWGKERSSMHQHHGPWKSAAEYLTSIANREIEWIKAYAPSQGAATDSRRKFQYSSPDQHSPDAHISALEKFRAAVPYIVPQDPDLVSPRFWHPDFHAGNIYVNDEGQISSIIDWQGAWTTPVFIGATPPLLLDYSVEMLMKLPDDFKSLEEAEKQKLRYQVAQSILIYGYETETANKNPLMHKMMHHPHGQTLKQLEAFASSTWDNCLFPLRECLINVEREWEHFGVNESCPYHFTEEEIERHYKETDTFNESQEFWKSVNQVLTDEGYTSNDTYEQAQEIVEVMERIQDQ